MSLLWIDAVCINQADDEEKNHQVALMAKIYQKAKSTIIWLGSGRDDNSDSALRYLKQVRPHVPWYRRPPRLLCAQWLSRDPVFRVFGTYSYGTDEVIAFRRLQSREYWRRVWTIQEILKSRQIEIRCGDTAIAWEEIKAYREWCKAWFHKDVSDLVRDLLVETWTLEFMTIDKKKGIFEPKECLGELMFTYTALFKSTDPRDRIYALLGLAVDCKLDSALTADYSKDIISLSRDVVKFCELTVANGQIKLAILVRQALGISPAMLNVFPARPYRFQHIRITKQCGYQDPPYISESLELVRVRAYLRGRIDRVQRVNFTEESEENALLFKDFLKTANPFSQNTPVLVTASKNGTEEEMLSWMIDYDYSDFASGPHKSDKPQLMGSEHETRPKTAGLELNIIADPLAERPEREPFHLYEHIDGVFRIACEKARVGDFVYSFLHADFELIIRQKGCDFELIGRCSTVRYIKPAIYCGLESNNFPLSFGNSAFWAAQDMSFEDVLREDSIAIDLTPHDLLAMTCGERAKFAEEAYAIQAERC